MKFKTTAIAMAVAGTVAAPIAVQAGADEIYASARVGVWNVDQFDQSQSDVRSFSSRFGARGETDLGNGLTGFGRYEWDVDFNNDLGEDDVSVRMRYVGLKGDWGSVLLGQTYHTFYNFVVGPNDNPWWHSGYAMVNYRGRTDNAVTYAGSAGMINFGASVYMTPDAEEEDIDQYEVGASVAIGDMTLGVAMQGTADDTAQGSAANDENIFGASLSGIVLGPVGLGFGVQSQDDDMSFLLDSSFQNAYLHVEVLDLDKDSAGNPTGDDRTVVSYTLGYTQSLGRKTTMYYEANYIDRDTDDSDDDRTAVMAVLKYDII
jgi:predicted porin